jgi:hypothetical protein
MFCEKCGKNLTEDSMFCDGCGHKNLDNAVQPSGNLSMQNEEANKHNKKVLKIFFSILAIVVILIIFFDSSDNSNSGSGQTASQGNANIKPIEKPQNISSQNSANKYTEVAESVVNIMCPYASEPFSIDSDGTGGSGTIMDDSGLVVSNSHIIPQDKDALNISKEGCFVILPDATTGSPKEVYIATPIVFNELSDEYDLALLTINDVYTDENGKKYGTYPKKFPAFDDTGRCKDEQIKLGESVRILGYPVSSGGYNLTITDGIVSSFSDDGSVLTSAKIDQGNSGGLAIDENGCMLGVPSAVRQGEYNNLGVIIPASTLVDFINKVDKKLKQ